MAFEFKLTHRVAFAETDMAGIVHFSNFFRYMETAEHGFYRSLGFSVTLNQFEPPLGFPRVHADCDYKRPLKFEDKLEIHLLVKEKRSRVLSYYFRFTKLGPDGKRELVATGSVTVVCVTHDRTGKMEAVSIPEPLA